MEPEYIIIHHSLTRDSGTVSWAAIRKYHVETLGYRDIGYHYGIEVVENPMDKQPSYEILMGRFPDEQGAHCPPRNRDSVGVCLIGDFDNYAVPMDQWNLAVRLCVWVKSLYPKILVSSILGHREAQLNRTCPGKNFNMDGFREAVDNRLWNKIG
jgi:N-acetylmuramoyl-L-alanine amidase